MILDKRIGNNPCKEGQPIVDGKTTCVKCWKLKEVSEFYKTGVTKRGLQSYCKSCVKEYGKIRDQKRKEDNYFFI